MMMMGVSYDDDGGIIWWWLLYHMMIWWSWCWYHMMCLWWSGDHDAGIICVWWWPWCWYHMMTWWSRCWDHMCMMFVAYVYDPPPRQTNNILLVLPTFYIMFRSRFYVISICSSSLSLITFSCVSILILQWLSSPHILTQHGLSHDTLQWLKKLKGFKADSDNPISLYIIT